ncbi:TetR/AcrR family transcriptional regulator [Pseudolysinimonas sp.]|uniref:TetR/AcrR family transcriptional regulator n=1 Tax=Pseudolysinimonas sp. TaxID=2680009 RepID=UPI00286A8CA7|nr:TetR/AcrR family transcriptional regulator [Pseudolysinimonas sp.]
MAQTHLEAPRVEGTAIIRNEPVQARSAARLTALLDAAAHVVHEIGYERLTTAMVAERAGASIGTVYRYFPDRIAVLQSLAARNVERTSGSTVAALMDPAHTDWFSALGAVFDDIKVAYRDEPGFASLRYGDVLDLRPATGSPAMQGFADGLFDALVTRFDLDGSDAARLAFSAVVVATDALTARAFTRDPEGDEDYLLAGVATASALMSPFWPTPVNSA